MTIRGFSHLLLVALLTGVSTAQVPSDVGPAPPVPVESAIGSSLRAADFRALQVAYRIALGGVRFCPDPAPATGMLLHHLADYDPAGQAIEIERYGLDRGSGVLAVIADSPAGRAGLRAGDVILTVDGVRLEDARAIVGERDRQRRRSLVEASEDLLESALRRGPVQLEILRGTRSFAIQLRALPGCPVRVRVLESGQLASAAHDGYVQLTTRSVAFATNDDELAFMIGHETAHVVLRHQQLLQGIRGGLFQSPSSNAISRHAEEEADRLGVKLAWAAGYDVSAVPPFLRRLDAAHLGWMKVTTTHPSYGRRIRVVQDVIAGLSHKPLAPPAGAP